VPILVAGEGVVLARFGINRLGSGVEAASATLRERRCVIPCDGFYEWRDEGGKQPYFLAARTRSGGCGGLRQVVYACEKVTAKHMRRAGLPAPSSWAPIW
jgi:hypothetical protein